MNSHGEIFYRLFVVCILLASVQFTGCGDGKDNETMKEQNPVGKTYTLKDVETVPDFSERHVERESSVDRHCGLVATELKRAILNMEMACTNVGFRTSSWAISIANGIRSIPDAVERKRLADLYFDQLAKIDPLRMKAKMRERALDNYAQLLNPYASLLSDLSNREKPFELMCMCLRNYHRAIDDERRVGADGGQNKRGRRWGWVGQKDRTWNFKAGLERFSIAVTNVFLPETSERHLLGGRFKYWERKLKDGINGGNTTVQKVD